MQIKFNTEKNVFCHCASDSAPGSVDGSKKTPHGGGCQEAGL